MMDMIVTLVVMVLWNIGGDKHSWARDLLVPIIMGISVFISRPTGNLGKDILIGILTIAACNIIRFGYGSYDPINDDKPSLLASVTHDRFGWWIRAIWGMFCGFVIFAPLIAFKPEPIMYIRAAAFASMLSAVCFTVVRLAWPKVPTDLAIGMMFSFFPLFARGFWLLP